MGFATASIVGREQFVVVSDISEQRLASGVAELRRQGIDCEGVVCDITDSDSASRLIGESNQHGTVTSVVHTAGVSPSMGDAERASCA
ncbi:SDR family NAD(P)-dependent oxidoreductase [Mycobacterium sp. ITM-2016-00316]|uniref:SDR family NAD(P)-dependent oxidoreductase n=1 Tax=Mycobacterium sp. ITM-2016-00316 TaxID=2099695 RepID=UPI0037CACC24